MFFVTGNCICNVNRSNRKSKLLKYNFTYLLLVAHCNSKEVIIVGGVGCNLRLQEMISIMAEERGGTVGVADER